MLISELSRTSGLSRDTIRFYEKIGLLRVPRTSRRRNNYKEYSDADLQRLLVIKGIRDFGFTLKEIREIIALYESDPQSCSRNQPLLKRHLQRIDETILRLTTLQKRLRSLVRCCSGRCSERCGLERNLRRLVVNASLRLEERRR